MKKIYLLVMLLAIVCGNANAECKDGPYGLKINGSTVVDAPKFGDNDWEGRVQYKASCVDLKVGDELQLVNQSCDATWMVNLDQAGAFENFNGGKDANKLTCKVAGKYDFYIKLSMQKGDLIYVELGKNCSGDTPGGGDDPIDPPVEPDDINYYIIGWINGEDHGETAWDTFEDEYLIEDGKMTIDCKMGSYICIKDHLGNFYRSRTQTTIADTQVTFEWQNGWAGGEKWAIPEGVNYIIVRSASFKGKIVLERVDKATYDAYHYDLQGIKKVETKAKARKQIIDGQLRIIRGDKMYDATGREL